MTETFTITAAEKALLDYAMARRMREARARPPLNKPISFPGAQAVSLQLDDDLETPSELKELESAVRMDRLRSDPAARLEVKALQVRWDALMDQCKTVSEQVDGYLVRFGYKGLRSLVCGLATCWGDIEYLRLTDSGMGHDAAFKAVQSILAEDPDAAPR